MAKMDFDLLENFKLIETANEFLIEGYRLGWEQDIPDDTFDLIQRLTQSLSRTTKYLESLEKSCAERQDKESIPLEAMGLSKQSYNGLKRYGINTLGDITNLYVYELRKIRNLGNKAISEVLGVLKKHGVSTKDDFSDTKHYDITVVNKHTGERTVIAENVDADWIKRIVDTMNYQEPVDDWGVEFIISVERGQNNYQRK